MQFCSLIAATGLAHDLHGQVHTHFCGYFSSSLAACIVRAATYLPSDVPHWRELVLARTFCSWFCRQWQSLAIYEKPTVCFGSA